MCEAENLALCIDQTVAILNPLSGTERAAKVMAHIGALRYIQWRQWRRKDAPDQVTIEPTARACRAATRKLVDGTEPGPGSIADGFGLGKGLVAVATEGLVKGTSPHRTARILQPGGSELGFGAAPHLCSHGHTPSRHTVTVSSRWGGCVAKADLVQLVQCLEPCTSSLGAMAGTPARDGGSWIGGTRRVHRRLGVLTCTYKGRAWSAHDEQGASRRSAHREAVCGHPTLREGRAAASWKRAHRAVSLKRE